MNPMDKSPEYRLAHKIPVTGESIDFEKLLLEERLMRIEQTLSTFIAWSTRELGVENAQALMEMLKEP